MTPPTYGRVPVEMRVLPRAGAELARREFPGYGRTPDAGTVQARPAMLSYRPLSRAPEPPPRAAPRAPAGAPASDEPPRSVPPAWREGAAQLYAGERRGRRPGAAAAAAAASPAVDLASFIFRRLRGETVARGATAAVTATGLRRAVAAATLPELVALANGVSALHAESGSRGTAWRQYSQFADGVRCDPLPVTADKLKAWVTSRTLTHLSERGRNTGELVHSDGVPALLGALRNSFTAGDPSWRVTDVEFKEVKRLCDRLRATVPVTAAVGEGLPMEVLQRLHARLRAVGTPAARRLRAWLAVVVALALRGTEVANLRWRELRASAALGLGMQPDAPKSGRYVLRRGEPRAAPHVPAEHRDFCALSALQEYAPEHVAALRRGGDMGDEYVFTNGAGAAWPAAAALALTNELLAMTDRGFTAGRHVGRDSSQALWQGLVGLTREQRDLAGGWKPATVIAKHYEVTTPEVLMALLAGDVARRHGGNLCCAAAQGAAPIRRR